MGKSKVTFIFGFKNVTPGILLKMFAISCIIFPCLFVFINLGFAYEGCKSDHRYFVTIDSGFNDVTSVTIGPFSERFGVKKPLLSKDRYAAMLSSVVLFSDLVKEAIGE
mgnify:FL=1